MGIKLSDIDESNVLAAIDNYKSTNILLWIPTHLITPETCLHAVKANGLSIKHLPDKLSTRKIRLAAIWQTHLALWRIPRDLVDNSLIEAAFESLVRQAKVAKYMKY